MQTFRSWTHAPRHPSCPSPTSYYCQDSTLEVNEFADCSGVWRECGSVWFFRFFFKYGLRMGIEKGTQSLALDSPASTATQVLERCLEGWSVARVGDPGGRSICAKNLSGAIRDVFGDNPRKA